MDSRVSGLVAAFERLEIEAVNFRHRDHVEVAFAMLQTYDFIEACARYARTIQAMAARVGAIDKFNTTVTFAFLSLIAERMNRRAGVDFDTFIASNPDLLERNVLSAWYSDERIDSPAARQQFLLPDLGQRGAV